jgi:hypothetical protein
MEVERKKGSDQQKSEESKKLLQKLRDQLYSSDGSIRRQAGFHLSWLQEDGLETLKATLFGNAPITTKNAAAYGMRKMRGRMKKMALQVLKEGLEYKTSVVRDVCKKALIMLEELPPERKLKLPPRKKTLPKLKIREIPTKIKKKSRVATQQTTHRRPPRK